MNSETTAAIRLLRSHYPAASIRVTHVFDQADHLVHISIAAGETVCESVGHDEEAAIVQAIGYLVLEERPASQPVATETPAPPASSPEPSRPASQPEDDQPLTPEKIAIVRKFQQESGWNDGKCMYWIRNNLGAESVLTGQPFSKKWEEVLHELTYGEARRLVEAMRGPAS